MGSRPANPSGSTPLHGAVITVATVQLYPPHDERVIRRLTEYEGEGVGDGEREEVVVGGGVHVAVASDDDARRHVANHARHQDQTVDHAE